MTATASFRAVPTSLFTDCHHIEEWEIGGPTDLANLALLCEHHHHLIHTKVWSMSGDANVEVRFVGPSAQVMTTRPSRLWAQVSDPKVLARTTPSGPAATGEGAGGSAGPKEPATLLTARSLSIGAGVGAPKRSGRLADGGERSYGSRSPVLRLKRVQSFSSIVTLSITTCSFGVPERLPSLSIFSTTSRPLTTSPKCA